MTSTYVQWAIVVLLITSRYVELTVIYDKLLVVFQTFVYQNLEHADSLNLVTLYGVKNENLLAIKLVYDVKLFAIKTLLCECFLID